MQSTLEVKDVDGVIRLVYTDDKGSVALGRRFPDLHAAERTRVRYQRAPDKLAQRVASARGEVRKVRTLKYVPVKPEQTEA